MVVKGNMRMITFFSRTGNTRLLISQVVVYFVDAKYLFPLRG